MHTEAMTCILRVAMLLIHRHYYFPSPRVRARRAAKRTGDAAKKPLSERVALSHAKHLQDYVALRKWAALGGKEEGERISSTLARYFREDEGDKQGAGAVDRCGVRISLSQMHPDTAMDGCTSNA